MEKLRKTFFVCFHFILSLVFLRQLYFWFPLCVGLFIILVGHCRYFGIDISEFTLLTPSDYKGRAVAWIFLNVYTFMFGPLRIQEKRTKIMKELLALYPPLLICLIVWPFGGFSLPLFLVIWFIVMTQCYIECVYNNVYIFICKKAGKPEMLISVIFRERGILDEQGYIISKPKSN